MRPLLFSLSIALLLVVMPALAGLNEDWDGDGLPWWTDNCIDVPNFSQCDTDFDGYGDACDGDFDNSGVVNATDFTAYFVPDFAAGTDSGVGTDMDCSGVVNASDFTSFFVPQFDRGEPGPSCCAP